MRSARAAATTLTSIRDEVRLFRCYAYASVMRDALRRHAPPSARCCDARYERYIIAMLRPPCRHADADITLLLLPPC